VQKHIKEHPEKHYYVIGIDRMFERMKPWLLPDFRKFSGTEEEVVAEKKTVSRLCDKAYEFAGKAVGLLLRLAKELGPRNYIIDAAHVTAARPRKLDFFIGFGKKIAVVFTPPTSELNKRIEEAKKMLVHPPVTPDRRITLIAQQKGRFTLPNEDDKVYDEITFPDSSREEAAKVVQQYKEEAAKEPVVEFPRRGRGRGRGRFRGRGRGGGRGRRRDDGPREDSRNGFREDSFRGRGRGRGRGGRGRGSGRGSGRGRGSKRTYDSGRDYPVKRSRGSRY